MKELAFSTISTSLLDLIQGTPSKIRFFNFSERTTNITLSKMNEKDKIGAYDATWVRVYTKERKYFDFLGSSIFFVSNKSGVMVMCSEDTKLLDANYFAAKISKEIIKNKNDFSSSEIYIKKYYSEVSNNLKNAYKKLMEFYSLQRQFKSDRVDIDSAFASSKNDLTRNYLRDLIFKSIMKENKKEIIDLIS